MQQFRRIKEHLKKIPNKQNKFFRFSTLMLIIHYEKAVLTELESAIQWPGSSM